MGLPLLTCYIGNLVVMPFFVDPVPFIRMVTQRYIRPVDHVHLYQKKTMDTCPQHWDGHRVKGSNA
jgi:hypothetical protein